jgi:hypothetical protein
MTRKVRFRRSRRRPPLTEDEILAWADAFYERHRRWPKMDDGFIAGTLSEKWHNVDMALREGYRGLPGGSSLARLLAERRGVRNLGALPQLSRSLILAYADAYHQRTGSWPSKDSGSIDEAPGETWGAVDNALWRGLRGLPGGFSLAQLLAKERDHRHPATVPLLSEDIILAWADAHYRQTGKWPRRTSGCITAAPGETWGAVQKALGTGGRGLPGGSSLARLLAQRRGVRNRKGPPELKEKQILIWANAHRRRTGKWPSPRTGLIEGSGGETWCAVDKALREGRRGLPGGASLARLLSRHAEMHDKPAHHSHRG